MRHLLMALFCFTLSASVVRVIDGDTFVATGPAWHGVTVTETVRVLGVDTPEVTGPTAAAGLAAKAFAAAWLGAGPVTVATCKRDSFGRALGVVTKGGVTLADALIQAGHGVRR
jgi:endonuclease YncB( thermonuclease family)